MYQFSNAVLGGSFDRLHAGHRAFLRFALRTAETISLGLTSDEYVKSFKNVANSLSFRERKRELEEFFRTEDVLGRVRIYEINANEIPVNLQTKVDVMIVTTDTLRGAEEINKIRQEKGLSPLPIVTFPLVRGKKGIISSTHIRKGEIDREGTTYLTEDMREYSFVLPDSLRARLKEPLGNIIDKSHLLSLKNTQDIVVTVGDVTTKTFLKHKVHPSIAVIDFIVERKKTFSKTTDLGFLGKEHVYRIENPKSHIRPEVFLTLSHLFYSVESRQGTSILQVVGEEDLIVLPVVLLAPLGTRVYYGQPKVGMVEVIVTENLKLKMRELLEAFKKRS